MKKIFYLVLCLFLLLGCENLSYESKDSFIQQDTSAPQQSPSPDNVDKGTSQETTENTNQEETSQSEKLPDNTIETSLSDNEDADKVPNEDRNQEIDKEPAQDTNEEANKEEVNQGTNPEDNNQGATENPSQGTNQENTDNQEVIFTEKPDNYTGEIWVQGVTKERGWVDVNKWTVLVDSTETNTCWMATSANVLADYYRRHNTQSAPSAIAIYQDIYQNSGGDEPGTYLNGIPKYVERTEVGIIYPTGLNRNCLCLSNCDDIQVMSKALIKNLHKGAAGIKFVWFGGDGAGHALTLWGAEFKEGILTKIYVTDSDDRYTGIKDYSVKTGTDREKTVIEVTDYSSRAKLREVYIPF